MTLHRDSVLIIRPLAYTILAIVLLTLPSTGNAQETRVTTMPRIEISKNGEEFVFAGTETRFTPWGFNFVGKFEHIVEEYWTDELKSVDADFARMKQLGANVVRLHLQLSTYMTSATTIDEAQLKRLRATLAVAQKHGLYLDLTGLGCYHIDRVPDWLDELSEEERWEVQAKFWEAIAKTCDGHPAVFCYDLMNEPVIGKSKQGEHPWLLGELAGMYFVQRVSNDPRGRKNTEIAEQWVSRMVAAIRKHDSKALVTVGVIPWAQVWPKAKPVFYAPDVAKHLDFVSVHFYPKSGEVQNAIEAVKVYDIGKPIVVEETFPLSCSIEELDQFIQASSPRVDGWVSHYFGASIDEHNNGAEPGGKATAKFLEWWRQRSQQFKGRGSDRRSLNLPSHGQRHVLVAAHRGGYASDKDDRAPENSLANLKLAIEKGFDVYETDIQRTADGVFVIMHDDTIDRETNGSGRISDMTFAQVQKLKKRYRDGSVSDEPVATLEQFLKFGHGRILFKPDMKKGVIEHFADLAKLIHRCEMEDQVFVRTGLNDRQKIASEFRNGCPKVEVMFKVNKAEQVKSVIAEFQPATIQINVAKGETISESKAKAIRQAATQGVLVETHVYGDEKLWEQLATLGVRMFHTTNPDAVLRHLTKNGWRETFPVSGPQPK